MGVETKEGKRKPGHGRLRGLAAGVLLLLLLGAYTWRTVDRNWDWEDEERLFRSALKVSAAPQRPPALYPSSATRSLNISRVMLSGDPRHGQINHRICKCTQSQHQILLLELCKHKQLTSPCSGVGAVCLLS